MRTPSSVAELFPQSNSQGLTAEQMIESRARFGANRLTPLPRESVLSKFLEKFDEPIIEILLGASLLKIAVDLVERDVVVGLAAIASSAVLAGTVALTKWKAILPTLLFVLAFILFGLSVALGQPSIEGLAVIIAVALATLVAFFSEYRSDREFEKLNAGNATARVKVLRDGRVASIPPDDLVVGDLVVLEPGDEIPADGRVLRANGLAVDQSLLTGESEPSNKAMASPGDGADGPERPDCLYRGTQVIEGLGQMVVANVGDDTMLGQIARRLSNVESDDAAGARVQQKLAMAKEETPLQQKLTVLARAISKIGYAAALAIFFALVVRGAFFANPRELYWPIDSPGWLAVFRNLLDYAVYMVIVIVVAVPEGLPMSVTVSLALAMRKMTKANALVRQLVATETIGSATIICTDKTGTLTQNRMQVQRVGTIDGVCMAGSPGFLPTRVRGVRPSTASAIDWIAANAAINSTGSLDARTEPSKPIGNRTEGALLLWLREAQLDYEAERLLHPPLQRTAFSSETKTMSTDAILSDAEIEFLKGAPEAILARCSNVTDVDGSVRPLTDLDRAAIAAQWLAATGDAMRTLAFAHRTLPNGELAYDGFVAIRDPIRPDVPQAIADCRAAGLDVTMITGDNPDTARAIARDIGLLDRSSAIVLTSDEFERMTDDEAKTKLPDLRVLARAKPLDKYRLVTLLQQQGHVVAMTGDGTNDAPSLKKADVGLAMGLTGTDVAKEASRIVLLDDAFGTIVRAVHWGRALYENIQKFLVFQLTINASALLIAFLGPFFNLKPPFTVLQLLWINVIMDTFAAIALCSEPPRAGLMKQQPKRRSDRIVNRTMLRTIAVRGGFFVVAMMGLLLGLQYGGWFLGDGPMSSEFRELSVRQVTIFFTAYVLFQVWNLINCRSLDDASSGLSGLHRNPLFLLIAGSIVLGQWAIVQFGGAVFAVEPLAWQDWLEIAGWTSSVLLFAEVSRFVRRTIHSTA